VKKKIQTVQAKVVVKATREEFAKTLATAIPALVFACLVIVLAEHQGFVVYLLEALVEVGKVLTLLQN